MMDEPEQLLAWQVKTRRELLGLTQSELAARVGVSEITVYNTEAAIHWAKSPTLKAYALALGCTIANLLQAPGEVLIADDLEAIRVLARNRGQKLVDL